MLVREVETDCRTGEVTERMVEMPVLTEAEGVADDLLRRSDEARVERYRRLVACDWTTLPDVPLSDALSAEWSTFRQALRDVTEQQGFPDAIDWPQPPAPMTVLSDPARGEASGV